MKNKRLIILILCALIALSCFLASCERYADPSEFVAKDDGYTLSTVRENNDLNSKILGANFYGLYFGKSNIAVSVAVYSSDNFNLSFDVRSGSLTNWQLVNRNKLVTAFNEIHSFVSLVDSLADTQTKTSDVYKFNHAVCGGTLEINEHTYNMMKVAKEMYVATDGAFNPAVYRLVDLWGFSSRIYSNFDYGESYDRQWDLLRDNYPLPDAKYIQAFSDPSFTDFSDDAVTLSKKDGKYYVTKNVRPAQVDGEDFQQWIDLGGIAKGYISDYIDGKLREIGIDRFSVDVGSSSMTFGKNYDGDPAAIGIASPFTMQSFIGVDVADADMSTSGQYLRNYVVDGVEYAHIIDGNTGAPAQTGIKLVSVIAPQGSDMAGKLDCLTTALTVMGKDGIIDMMNGYLKDNGITVYAVYGQDGKKQVLSNADYDSLAYVSGEISQYSWNVNSDNGQYSYNADAPLIEYKPTAPIVEGNYTWLIITLAVVVALAVIATVIVHILKGRKRIASNVANAKRDKPFKVADVGIYAVVALLILVLFVAIFGGDGYTDSIVEVRVVDMETQQVLFVCNVARRSWNAYDGTNGWSVAAEAETDLTVTFRKVIDGEERFNTLVISVGDEVSVKMTDSLCGVHQECVRNFQAVTAPNGSIVCSPNRLKVITG